MRAGDRVRFVKVGDVMFGETGTVVSYFSPGHWVVEFGEGWHFLIHEHYLRVASDEKKDSDPAAAHA